MEFVILPGTEISVSRLGVGGCPLGGHGWGHTDEDRLLASLDRALEQGLNFFDTAVELANGLLWLLVGWCYRGDLLLCGVHCALSSCLLALSVIDWRHYIIPDGTNVCVFVWGLIRLVADWENRSLYAWGFAAVGGIFWLLHLITGGNGMGLGDVKLAAAAGLLLGWQKMIPAAFLASLSGICIHGFRMKRGAGNRLAFGPYLSLGILLTTLAGEDLIQWNLGL